MQAIYNIPVSYTHLAPLVAQLKANPKTIVFTEGNDPRILEAASKLLAEGVLKVVMVGNEAECKACLLYTSRCV